MPKSSPKRAQLEELLLQALQTEIGGVELYETAIECAVDPELASEWRDYLEETRRHRQVMEDLLATLEIDASRLSPGREVVAHIGESLVHAIRKAQAAGDAEAAQLVAAECVVHAETRDHFNWELIGLLAPQLSGTARKALKEAYDSVEQEEDHHLFHTKGWLRELWIRSLGLPAVLPPPEEIRQVETAIGASRAAQAREQMLKSAN